MRQAPAGERLRLPTPLVFGFDFHLLYFDARALHAGLSVSVLCLFASLSASDNRASLRRSASTLTEKFGVEDDDPDWSTDDSNDDDHGFEGWDEWESENETEHEEWDDKRGKFEDESEFEDKGEDTNGDGVKDGVLHKQ
jgi:hypothetical protein